MKKTILSACAVCCAAAVFLAVLVLKDAIALRLLMRYLMTLSPGEVTAAKAEADVMRASMRFADIRFKNPPGWECESDSGMLEISRLDADYSWKSLFLGQNVLPRLVLSVDELRLVRNQDGALNIRSLAMFGAESAEEPRVRIGQLDLELRRIVYTDCTRTPARVVSFNVGIRERFENITDVREFSRELLARVLADAGLRSMVHAALGEPVTGKEHAAVCFPQGCVNAEVARTEEARRIGLMGREALAEGDGMLFVFPEEGEYRFWMKNMFFPIDLIWIAADGRVRAVTQNAAPCTGAQCPSFSADAETRFVLEVPAGYISRHGITVADTARMEDVH
jgi:hypothetical protein